MAQRNVQEKRFRAVVGSASAEQKSNADIRSATRRSRNSRPNKTAERPECVLDAVFLMKTHHLKDPSDLCAADVSDRNLTSAETEEFAQFTCAAYVNAAENTLTLESFRTFPALRELELSMNGIRRIHVNPRDFPMLEVLDLSYNTLSPRDIPQLGVLPRLRVLYLTGNGLAHLPPDLSAPPVKDTAGTMFPSLEILMLDDNKLSHPDVFESLAGLRSLRLLNLDKNAISAVPYLHQSATESRPPAREAELGGIVVGSSHKTQEARGEDPNQVDEEKLTYMVLPNANDSDRTEVIFHSARSPSKYDPLLKPPETTVSSSFLPSFILSSTEQLTESVSPPLPSLRTLSLADNKITHEEGLVAVALFLSLEELVIYGNPLTTLRKGDPPLLGNFLQQRLGIKIIRKKSTGLHKPHVIIPIKEKRKVRTHVPKIPKQPLMLEPPLYPFLRLPFHHESDVMESVMSSSPLPPIRTSSERQRDTPLGQSPESARSSDTSEGEMSFSCDPAVESVFMTQVDHLPDPPHDPSPLMTFPELDTASDQKPEHKEIPEKFRGYEELYDVNTDPDFIEPVGIQNNVRALEFALRHLLVYRDCKPRLHSVQKPYIPPESKSGKDLRPVPRRNKTEVVADILAAMREQRHLVERPLDSALRKGRSSSERREAKRLLKELQKKYAFFHAEAVKRAAELEAGLRENAKELLEAQRKLGDISRKATPGGSGALLSPIHPTGHTAVTSPK